MINNNNRVLVRGSVPSKVPGPQGETILTPANEARIVALEGFVTNHEDILDVQFIYIDAAAGSDANDGATTGTPVQTLAGVVAAMSPSKQIRVVLQSDVSFDDRITPVSYTHLTLPTKA